MRALVLVCVLVCLSAPVLAGPTSVSLANGRAQHDYVNAGVPCSGEAEVAVTHHPAAERILVTGYTPCIPGYFSLVGGCKGGPAREIVCVRQTATVSIYARLGTDGAFELRWSEPTFTEVLAGGLARTDP